MYSSEEFGAELKKARAAFNRLTANQGTKPRNRKRFTFGDLIRSVEGIGKTLRVDTVINAGEGFVAAARIQSKIKDRTGEKPYLILDVRMDRLVGAYSFQVRDDRGHRGAFWNFPIDKLGRADTSDDEAFSACVMRYLGARAGLEGHGDAARVFLETLERRAGLGYLVFGQRHASALAARWSREQTAEKLEPERWYLDGELPPTGFLHLYLFKTPAGNPGASTVNGFALQLTKDGTKLVSGPTPYPYRSFPSRENRGRTILLPDGLADELIRHATPEFGSDTEAAVEMPRWTKPLDSMAACLERIKDRRHAIDLVQHRQAVEFLLEHRDDIDFNVDLMVPSEGAHRLPEDERAKWREIFPKLSSYCACCGVSKIAPANPRVFAPEEAKAFRMRIGQKAVLVPDAAGKPQATAQLRLYRTDKGAPALEILLRPYSQMLLMNWLMPERHLLTQLSEALAKKGGPIDGEVEGQKLFQITGVDPAEGEATLVPDGRFSFMLD